MKQSLVAGTANKSVAALLMLVGALWTCFGTAACGSPKRKPTASAPPSTLVGDTGVSSETPLRAEAAAGSQGAVASAEANASRIGLDVLKRGGHAVDAAIAVAFALAVTHPSAGNLAGGGFMVVRTSDGQTTAIDYRETAPSKATATMFVDAEGKVSNESLLGAKAAGIPGTVAGLALAHKRFGKLSWKELVEPAIALAEEGHPLDKAHAESMAQAAAAMQEAGFADAAKYYLGADGQPLAEGALFRQAELAKTLRMVAKQGANGFYRGTFGKQLAQKVQKLGGLWTAKDLGAYKAKEREPITFDYRGFQVITMPPPSAGGVVLRQVLGASELLHVDRYPWHSPRETHLYVEAARRSYAERNRWLGDPDFVSIPLAKLLNVEHLRELVQDVDPVRATPSTELKLADLSVADATTPTTPNTQGTDGEKSPETTHFSVVDGTGNAVANTYTLNGSFGAKVVVPGTGLLLNNEMDDFAAKPGSPNAYGLVQGEANAIAPGKRMLSSMTPTILVRDGKVRAVLGAMGGSTISTTVVQLVRALIDYHLPLAEAVAAPRIHHQWLPDQVTVERGVSASLIQGLRRLGHKVEYTEWNAIGHANCITVDPRSNTLIAVGDAGRGSVGVAAY